jgi:hypothetical protein
MNQLINAGRKSIEKSNRGGRKSSELSEKSINMAGNSNSENKENDEKMIYAKKTSLKENPKKSTNSKKSGVGEKGPTPGQKSIDELMSEVVISCGKYFCPEKCGKWYNNKNPIKKHLLSHRPKSEWPWVCLFCGRHFQVRSLKKLLLIKMSTLIIFLEIFPRLRLLKSLK